MKLAKEKGLANIMSMIVDVVKGFSKIKLFRNSWSPAKLLTQIKEEKRLSWGSSWLIFMGNNMWSPSRIFAEMRNLIDGENKEGIEKKLKHFER